MLADVLQTNSRDLDLWPMIMILNRVLEVHKVREKQKNSDDVVNNTAVAIPDSKPNKHRNSLCRC